jgi:WhiB family redox-sensing transcriptional regulator
VSTLWDSPAPRLELWPPRACEGMDADLFFADGRGDHAHRERATRICRGCKALEVCAEYAIPVAGLTGIWGGMSQQQRTRARNKQQKEAG